MDTTPPSNPTPPPAITPDVVTEDKTVAIVSYLTPIGLIIAIVQHGSKKTKLGAFHLRQSLGLMLTWLVCWVVLMIIPVIGWILIPILGLAMFVLWLMGFIAAANGQMKSVPVLGEHYQKWFANTFT